MRLRVTLCAFALAGCASATPTQEPILERPDAPPASASVVVESPAVPTASTSASASATASAPVAAPKVEVVMTAVTLADECGGAPSSLPAPQLGKKAIVEVESKADKSAKHKRACEQTSLQLSISAEPGTAPAQLTIKVVEIFDEKGKSLGVLKTSAPNVWQPDAGVYAPWDEKVPAGSKLSVTYSMTQPVWAADRFNKSYTVKAVVSVGGIERPLSKDIYLSGGSSLSPMVKT
jgi:hypothetical protein